MKLFKFRALLLAPLVAPLLFSLADCGGNKAPVFAFLFSFVIGSIISYGVTVTMWLPCLFCLSLVTALRFYKVVLLGAVLGFAGYIPVVWVMWKSSGPDSGPPTDSYISHLARSLADPFALFFPLAGLITAIAWWFLAKEKSLPKIEPAAVS